MPDFQRRPLMSGAEQMCTPQPNQSLPQGDLQSTLGNAELSERLMCEAPAPERRVPVASGFEPGVPAETGPERRVPVETGPRRRVPVATGPASDGVVLIDPASPARTVDDAQVGAIIRDLLEDSGLEGRDAVKDAWSAANFMRRANPDDMNLTAAEHYLWSCSETEGLGSGMQQQLLTTGYEGIKGLLDLVGQRDLLSTDGTSTTPSSLDVYGWGMAGATQHCGDLE